MVMGSNPVSVVVYHVLFKEQKFVFVDNALLGQILVKFICCQKVLNLTDFRSRSLGPAISHCWSLFSPKLRV